MARAAASLLIVGLGGLAAVAATTAPADPPVDGRAATVWKTVTKTRTVDRRVAGLNAREWRARAVGNKRAENAKGRRLDELRRVIRSRATTSLHGLVSAFLCIHRYEGGWGADTGNGYHGGLQMDRDFMGAYGSWAVRRWGDAENWPSGVQIVVALTAYYSGRGFYPWPNTARMCGLL